MSFNRYMEQEMVVQNVKKELYRWNSSYIPERLPSHPVELSYWVIQNLPLDDDLRLNLMGIDSAVQRLRCSLSIVQKVQTLCKVLYYCIHIYFRPVIFPLLHGRCNNWIHPVTVMWLMFSYKHSDYLCFLNSYEFAQW